MVAEIVGGIVSGSLAIITDATHLLSDVAGFLISLFALSWSQKGATLSMSYGFHRAEILGALVSISIVWAITFYLVLEAIERLRNPVEINGATMMVVAILGVIINGIIGFLLHGHDHPHQHSYHEPAEDQVHHHQSSNANKNLNIRSAFVHAIGDLIQSVGVLIAAIIIWVRPEWAIADPLCTFLFSFLVLGSTIFLARDTFYILMEGTPREICPETIHRELLAVAGVKEVHDLHVWSLAPGKTSATVHITIDWSEDVLDDDSGSGNTNRASMSRHQYEEILTRCQLVICAHQIHHVTIQIDPDQYLAMHCHNDCWQSSSHINH